MRASASAVTKGTGDQRARHTAHKRLIKLQPVLQAEVIEEDVHGLARLAHVESGKRVDKAARSLAVRTMPVKKEQRGG